jgi:hypothetical protein
MPAAVKPLEASPASPALDASDALGAVVNSAAAVARAELRLAAAEARAWLTRIGFGLVLLWLSLSLCQIFVLLLALTPVLSQDHRWTSLGLMLCLSLVPAVSVSWLAVRELRRLKELGHGIGSHRDQRS